MCRTKKANYTVQTGVKMETVHIGLEKRSYNIHIGKGLLQQAGTYILPLLKRPFVTIITSETVAKHHLATLQKSLKQSGIRNVHKILPDGEATKSFQYLENVTNFLLQEKVERDDVVIAFGGGVIGDLTGFAAGILRRGINFIQIPTTLLAQVDSSVGGKTAINSSEGKNLIGLFHQPILVLTDISVLDSLDERQLHAGYAEILKYAALGNREFFNWLEDNVQDLLSRQSHALTFAIQQSCQAKANIVTQDEYENGHRALLNLGHTFAHAYEAITGFSDNLLHGEAVALGMCLAFHLSVNMGFCTQDEANVFVKHLKTNLPTTPQDIKAIYLCAVTGGILRLVNSIHRMHSLAND